MTQRLKGKVAIVTGGGSGIGQGIALAFAREGADVVVVDVNLQGAQSTVAGIKAAGQTGLASQTDVSSPEQVNAMVAAAREKFGRVDILLNCAGVVLAKSLIDTTVEEWDRTMAINLRGHFLCLQAVSRIMIEQGSGKIINMSSMLAGLSRPNRGVYSATKAAITSLTKTAAIELAPHGICVNAIAPGSIETAMSKAAPMTPEEERLKLAAIPMRRRGVPEDVAGSAVFLASSDADYVTGHVLAVDGGYTIMVA